MLIREQVQVLEADLTKAHLVHLSQVLLQLRQGREVGIRTTQGACVLLETVERISSFSALKQDAIFLGLEEPSRHQLVVA